MEYEVVEDRNGYSVRHKPTGNFIGARGVKLRQANAAARKLELAALKKKGN